MNVARSRACRAATLLVMNISHSDNNASKLYNGKRLESPLKTAVDKFALLPAFLKVL